MDMIFLRDNDEPVTTSLIIAEGMGIEHRAVLKLIEKYTESFNELGNMPIKIMGTGGRPCRYAIMTEVHVMFLFSLMRNTENSTAAAILFIKSFKKAKNCLKEFLTALNDFDFDDTITDRYVYAAIDKQGRIKIGISNNPERRIKELNIGNADTLELIFTKKAEGRGYSDEIALHNSAKDYRIRSEWFSNEAKALLT